MFKEVMNDLWLARISSLSNEVGLYVVLLEVLLFMPNDYRSVLYSFGISTIDEELDLPSLYWIPKLHKCPFKQCYIAGFVKCSTKPISKSLFYRRSKLGFRVTVTLAPRGMV
jgi:hypothetical protein